MNVRIIVVFFIFISFLFNCKSEDYVPKIPQIIPIPSSQTINKGHFVLDNSAGISYDNTFKVSGDFLRNFIQEGSDIKLDDTNDIQFVLDKTIENTEGYKLDIQPYQITISAKSDQGA